MNRHSRRFIFRRVGPNTYDVFEREGNRYIGRIGRCVGSQAWWSQYPDGTYCSKGSLISRATMAGALLFRGNKRNNTEGGET